MTVLVGLRYAEGAVVAATARGSPEYRCMVKLAVEKLEMECIARKTRKLRCRVCQKKV